MNSKIHRCPVSWNDSNEYPDSLSDRFSRHCVSDSCLERESLAGGPSLGPLKKNDLVAELGEKYTVRKARPNELGVSRSTHPDTSIIHNPTRENLVFNVAIKGDEVFRGSTFMSVSHETWLPAGARLVVSNLYWSTPAMARDRVKEEKK